jgi:hypothetical protein
MHSAVQPVDALDAHRIGAGAVNARAHLDETGSEVTDLRLSCGIFDDCFAARERRRHHDRVGCADGDLREANPAAPKPPGASATT